MYFPTKKDIWFFFIIWGVILAMIAIYIFGGDPIGLQLITYKSILGYIMTSLILIMLLWIWFGTGYKIDGEYLNMRFGPFKSKIKIKDIKKIRRTKSPFTAPALSVDRLEISYGKFEVVDISPKSEKELIHALLAINPNIQLDDIDFSSHAKER